MRKSSIKFAAPLLALALFAVLASAVLAHPLGNFTINHYARLEPTTDQIRVRYALDFAEIPTFQEKQTMDSDGNGEISDAERDAYLETLIPGIVEKLSLSVDGASIPLTVEPGSAELVFSPGQGGLEVMRIALWLNAPLELSDAGSAVEFRDDSYRERLGWREIVAQGADGVTIQDSNVPAQDASQELTNYPENLLNDPPNVRAASFTAVAGAAAARVSTANPITTGGLGAFDRTRDEFGKLMTDNQDLSPIALAVAFLAAMALGALHSFSPGHGKAVVGAYLVGSRGNWQHAVFLGLVVTATHTAGVYALGFVTLFLSAYILPEQLFPWLGFVSGLLVALIGMQLFVQRFRAARSHTTSYDLAMSNVHTHDNGHAHSHDHEHENGHAGTHSHDHEHENGHAHTHPHDLDHDHEHIHADGTVHSHDYAESAEQVHVHADGTTHSHTAVTEAGDAHGHDDATMDTRTEKGKQQATQVTEHSHSHNFATPEEEEAHAREHLAEIQALEKPSWRNLVSLGVSGGLLPCPSALVVMLSAIALGRVLYGLFLIVGFSLGLAGVLVLTGLVLLYAGRFAGKFFGGQKMGWFMRYVPIVGAGFVAILGIGIALESILQTSFIP